MIGLLKKKIPSQHVPIMWGHVLVTFLNPYSYLLMRKHPQLLAAMDEVHVDGISLVLMLRLAGISAKRSSFDMTSLAKTFFEYCEENSRSVYFIGAKAHEIEQSVANFQQAYPSMHVVGYRDGYIENEWEQSIIAIRDLAPDFVVVGMGTPLQEKVLVDLRNVGFEGGGFTCGGFLHQSASGQRYYPKWADRLHLRWLYRIWDEPKLLKRYVFQYPYAALILLVDILRKR